MRAIPFLLLTTALPALGCAQLGLRSGEDPATVARVEGEDVTLDELDAFIEAELFAREVSSKPPTEQYEVRKEALERLVERRVLGRQAEAQGLTVDELVARQLSALGPVNDAEVEAFFDANRERLPPEAAYEDVAGPLRQLLERQRDSTARAALRAQGTVEIVLEAPRFAVEATGPARGPEDAAVVIVAFSDYQCPFCKRSEPVMEALLERYPEQVRLVYRHLPLDSIHPRARAAAEAAVCAGEQESFFEYHAALFSNPGPLSDEDLANQAQQIGLDEAAFRACREREDVKALVQNDVDAAHRVGVNGTPAFFVNGRLLTGSQPLDEFVRLVESELERP
jgi:protein-disulfide isomerase